MAMLSRLRDKDGVSENGTGGLKWQCSANGANSLTFLFKESSVYVL